MEYAIPATNIYKGDLQMINHENRRKIIIIIISIVVAVVLVSIAISELRSHQERTELGEHEYQELLNDITNFHSGYLLFYMLYTPFQAQLFR